MTRRLVHLGIGAFARAHTLAFTAAAGGWDVVAFTGRSPEIAEVLTAQDGRYGLVIRGPERDEVQLIDVIAAAHPAGDTDALQSVIADPDTHVVTLTITEKGYSADPADPDATPARLARALRARREAGVEEPLALVSCDNLVDNGSVLAAAVLAAVDAAGDAETAAWFPEHVDVVSTMVDRITPAAGPDERRLASAALGFEDRATVVTEPFREWVLADVFRGARPAWEDGGAVLTEDVSVHEARKLRLLNGAHTLLAYEGQLAGHTTVPAAIADPAVLARVQDLWAEASRTLPLPDEELLAYQEALLERFANPRLADRLLRIAADGTEKLAVRSLPVIAELGGPEHAPGQVEAVRAWTRWVTAEVLAGHDIADPRSEGIAEAARLEDERARVRALVGLLAGDAVDRDALADAVLAGDPQAS